MNELRGIYVIWLRDVRRFVREKPRVAAMIGQPFIYLLVMGAGLGGAMRDSEVIFFDYQPFILPGIVGMTILFGSFLAAASLIWDREFGFMKAVLAAPVSSASVVIGKVLGGTTLALIQASFFLLALPFFDLKPGPVQIAQSLGVMALIGVGFASLGVLVAPRMESHEGFQMVMTFLVLPLFLLSGAFFPLWSAGDWIQTLARFDPLAYGVELLRHLFYTGSPLQGYFKQYSAGPRASLVVLGLFASGSLALAIATFNRRE